MGNLSNVETTIMMFAIIFTTFVLGFAFGIAYQRYEIRKRRG